MRTMIMLTIMILYMMYHDHGCGHYFHIQDDYDHANYGADDDNDHVYYRNDDAQFYDAYYYEDWYVDCGATYADAGYAHYDAYSDVVY